MLNSVDNVSFKSWNRYLNLFLPRKMVRYSTHTPTQREYKEFEFMPELRLNPFIAVFKNVFCKKKAMNVNNTDKIPNDVLHSGFVDKI